MNSAQLNALSRQIIGAAITVHRELGPGLDELDYELALSTELDALHIRHRCQQPQPVVYKGVRLDAGYRLDLLVEDALIVEVKSVEELHPVHEAQLLTYLRLSCRKLGLLLNFDVPVLKQGIRRRVLGLDEDGIEFAPPGVRDCAEGLVCGPEYDPLSHAVLRAAIEVHRHLGPGLLRSAYEECLCYELSVQGLRFERRKPLAVRYRDVALPKPAEIDLIIAGQLPLMIVSVAAITPLLEARLIAQLKAGGWPYGLLLNFSDMKLADGVRRLVNPKAGRK
jgi:GxxExxY protein